MISYYIDPGSGFTFAQSSSVFLGFVLALLGGMVFYFRYFLKKFWILILILIAAVLVIGGLMMRKKEDTQQKVIILGIDGMDPEITEELMRRGELPNFAELKKNGAYSELATTVPAESLVAWSSFSTGLRPGNHGVFGFIMRNRENYLPYLAMDTVSADGKVKRHKEGEDFWNILSKNRIPSFIYFHPNTYPPDKIRGRMLSGMGVPDVTGTLGRFSFYTTRADFYDTDESRGKIIPVAYEDNIIKTEIYGPRVDESEVSENLSIKLDEKHQGVHLEFQGNSLSLKEGSWSGWQEISFKVGFFKRMRGVVKFYLKSVSPELELYASPVNFSPEKPYFSISYPGNYSGKLARQIGVYHTQGMPYDTSPLNEGIFDDRVFLEHVDDILNRRKEILENELEDFSGGAFFFYFGALDTIQHMFWRYLDPHHPLYSDDAPFKNAIHKYYKEFDSILGEVKEYVDEDTLLIILSDHGFGSRRNNVHLNRWLLKKGYLYLKEGADKSAEFFENVDWSRTKAYALGFGGIYINKFGREPEGIVRKTDYQDLKAEIKKELRRFRNPQTKENVVHSVYLRSEEFQGRRMEDAPDLFVGFNDGYRVSGQTVLGAVPHPVIEQNKTKWSGDHLIDPELVPGVIFVNRQAELKKPAIIDIAPTILNYFGIDEDLDIDGKGLPGFKKRSAPIHDK